MFNYENLGGKIKNMAVAIAISIVISGVIVSNQYGGLEIIMPFCGISCLVVFWIMSGFGQLVEDVHCIVDEIRYQQEQELIKAQRKEQERDET